MSKQQWIVISLVVLILDGWLILQGRYFSLQHEQSMPNISSGKEVEVVEIRYDYEAIATVTSQTKNKSSLSSIISKLIKQLHAIKQVINNLRCVGKLYLRNEIQVRRWDQLSNKEFDSLYAITGLHYQKIYKEAEPSLEEQHRLDKVRLDYLVDVYNNNPSDLNNRKILNICVDKKDTDLCSANLLSKLKDRMADDFQNWLLMMNLHSEENTDEYNDLLVKAVYSRTNNTFRGQHIKQVHDKLYPEFISSTSDAFNYALGVDAATTITGYGHLFKVCTKQNTDDLCLALGQRLVSDNVLAIEALIGYSILKNYYRAVDNEKLLEQAEQDYKSVQDEFRDYGIFKTPTFHDAYYEYILSIIDTKTEEEMIRLMGAESKRLLDENPALCVY